MPLLFLCVGSFLNVIAHRLIHYGNQPFSFYHLFIKPSHCPHCSTALRWFELIPVISWAFLKGNCRSCSKQISALYPFIELLTMGMLTLLWFTIDQPFFWSYFIFFCALIVSIRTDLEHLLISPLVTLWLIPVGYLLSSFGLLPLPPLQSIGGSIIGYLALWVVAKLFTYLTGKQGIGEGDFDLLAFIGAFIGPFGVWCTVLIASLSGTLIGAMYLLITKRDRTTPIPFGPFLAVAAMIYSLANNYFFALYWANLN